LSPNESDRLKAVHRYQILGTPPEPTFDSITERAARLFSAPVALVALVDESRCWWKSHHGLEAQEVPRDSCFSAYAILSDDVMQVSDARSDPRFAGSPLVSGASGICFCAAAPLKSPDGFNLGALCVLDTVPRAPLTAAQTAMLRALAALVVDELELRLAARKSREELESHRQQESLLALAFESAPVSLAVADEHGLLVAVNNFALGDRSSRDLVGGPLSRMAPAETVSPYPTWPAEWRIRCADGRVVEVLGTVRPVATPDERRLLVLALTDVTALKQRIEYTGWVEKMDALTRLAGKVAHDFNNLLMIITGFSRLLKNSMDPTDPLSAFADEITAATDRATVLTSRFLLFSGKRIGKPGLLNLNSLIVDLLDSLRQAAGRDVELATELASDLRAVRADRDLFGKIVTNLVSNACEAMPSGGKLTIETANVDLGDSYVATHPGVEAGRYVALAVSDTGMGMEPSTVGRLFEPFFSTKTSREGTGLMTVYGIARQYGGHISVESRLGAGTKIQICFPAATETTTDPDTLSSDRR
jgi:signal transduction histidine kinase